MCKNYTFLNIFKNVPLLHLQPPSCSPPLACRDLRWAAFPLAYRGLHRVWEQLPAQAQKNQVDLQVCSHLVRLFAPLCLKLKQKYAADWWQVKKPAAFLLHESTVWFIKILMPLFSFISLQFFTLMHQLISL